MKIDRVYLTTYARDVRQTRICIASIRYFHPDTDIYLIIDEKLGPMPWRNPEQYLVGGNKAKLKRAFFEALSHIDSRLPRSVQWDSFRACEGWVAGCATFNIGLDLYGPELLVMPTNWTHYIGVNFEKPAETIERLSNEPQLLTHVARQGQQWAVENYSPRKMAGRLLDLVGKSHRIANAEVR